MSKESYIGIMSGTSMDSVDVVLCCVDKEGCELLHSLSYPFPGALKQAVLAAISGIVTLHEVGALHHRLGKLFGEAALDLITTFGVDIEKVEAIGLHGQTLWHEPYGKYPFSLQLGDPSTVAALTALPVVADFRAKDIALGGQGAPLAPVFHNFLFGLEERICSVVNIGGMANISVLTQPVRGYDTGCGNVLMDLWVSTHLGEPYDNDGVWARSGTMNPELLETMLDDPYFHLPVPKSTGRETFHEVWLRAKLEGFHLDAADVQRTLLELTAVSIANEVMRWKSERMILCGGGAQNSFLVERLEAVMPGVEVDIAENADMLEAMMMAWLAYKRIHQETVSLREVTGAKENSILGAIYR